MKDDYFKLYLRDQESKSGIKKNPYSRKHDIASKVLKNFSLICAGGYLGSLLSDDLYAGIIFLTLALGSAGVRHYLLERKKRKSFQSLQNL